MDEFGFYNVLSSLRIGLPATSTFTSSSTVTTLVGNINVSSNLSAGGQITNNVLGALSMRAYDDTGIYAATTLTAGTILPPPFTTKPIMEQQVSTLSLTAAQFGTISASYSLKINGYIQPPATGTYLFRATYRDGLSLYVASQKLVDSWIYQGTVQQAVGTLTMYSNVWAAFALEHTAGASERLLIEWANPGGTYVTMNSSNFTFAYDMKEVPQSLMGSSYFYGRTNFADTANLIKGAYLPNATSFTGNTSELTNDASFIKSGATSLNIAGTVTAAALTFSGTTAGTVLQLANTIATISGTVTTTSYAALGVTPGTALDRYAWASHRWWTGSSGTMSGTVSMQLSTTGLTVPGNATFSGAISTPVLIQSAPRFAFWANTTTSNLNSGTQGAPNNWTLGKSSDTVMVNSLQSNGGFAVPFSGNYTITFSLRVNSVAQNVLLTYFAVVSNICPTVVSNTISHYSYSQQISNNNVFTGFLNAGDTALPTLFLTTSGNIAGASDNILSIVLNYRTA